MRRCQAISVLALGKKGRLYLRFLVLAVVLGGAVYVALHAYSAFAVLKENSTFKWFKRTLYQPQNRSLVGYWKLDGDANDSSSYGNMGAIVRAVSNLSQTFSGVNNSG